MMPLEKGCLFCGLNFLVMTTTACNIFKISHLPSSLFLPFLNSSTNLKSAYWKYNTFRILQINYACGWQFILVQKELLQFWSLSFIWYINTKILFQNNLSGAVDLVQVVQNSLASARSSVWSPAPHQKSFYVYGLCYEQCNISFSSGSYFSH